MATYDDRECPRCGGMFNCTLAEHTRHMAACPGEPTDADLAALAEAERDSAAWHAEQAAGMTRVV